MFRAIQQANESSIISLAPEWDDPSQLSALRQQCRDGEVCCPLCRSTVTLRAGEIKRRHFAHDARSECPLANEDATRLAGRHLIYSWLVSRMPAGSVTLEEELPGVNLPSPVDVVCDLPDLSIGYYFVHRNIRKPENRVKVERALHGSEILKCMRWSPPILWNSTSRDGTGCFCLRRLGNFARCPALPGPKDFATACTC